MIKGALNDRTSNIEEIIKESMTTKEWPDIKRILRRRIKQMRIYPEHFHVIRKYIKIPKVMRDPIMYYHYLKTEGIEDPWSDPWMNTIYAKQENFRSKDNVHVVTFKMSRISI